MKTLKYILIGFIIIILIYSSISCSKNQNRNQKQVVLQSLSKTFPKELLTESSSIMAKRLKSVNINNFTIDEDIDHSQLIIKLNDDADIQTISETLASRGEFCFLGTLKREDVLMNLYKKLSPNCTLKLDSILGITGGKVYPDAIIGQANSSDTFAINKFFRSKAVKSLLPKNILLCWSSSLNNQNKLALYALSAEDYKINRFALDEAKTEKEDKSFAITMCFKQNFWGAWENLTKNNMNKSIAFVVDGRVYSAPIVRSVISGGKVEITGDFSEKEANSILAIISCGPMPLDFMVK